MKKLRVANTSYMSSIPFRGLAELDFVEYQENLANENARKLSEDEVDVALVPMCDFALHGGYVGLDFGITCELESELLTLFAHQDVHLLRTIYLYSSSSASALLLRLLLKRKWRATPRLVRTNRELGPQSLAKDEGVIVRKTWLRDYHKSFPVAVDLVKEWHEDTGHPFVFLIWATRPGVLDMNQYRLINENFHRMVNAFTLSPLTARAKFPHPNEEVIYYFDPRIKEALNFAFILSEKHHLLPPVRYQSGTYTLLDRKPTLAVKERAVDQVLLDAIEGGRIGVRDGVRLAQEATLADLSLAASMIREKRHSTYAGTSVFTTTVDEANRSGEHCALADQSNSGEDGSRIARIRLFFGDHRYQDITFYETLVHRLKTKHGIAVEGFSAATIIGIAGHCGLTISEVVSRLAAAGLDAVPATGGGMLIDKVMRLKGLTDFSAGDWLRTMKWVHRFGLSSSCSMIMSRFENWEARMNHLQKLRVLQDDNPGFARVQVGFSQTWDGDPPAELRLRGNLITRLFLDNVPALTEASLSADPFSSVLNLYLAGNEVSVDIPQDGTQSSKRATVEMLQELTYHGLDFSGAFSEYGSDLRES